MLPSAALLAVVVNLVDLPACGAGDGGESVRARVRPREEVEDAARSPGRVRRRRRTAGCVVAGGRGECQLVLLLMAGPRRAPLR